MVDVHPQLAFFATSPPTPPKSSIQSTVGQLHDSDQFLQIVHPVLLDTPDESPSSSAECCGASSRKPPKRVLFSPWTKYHKPLGNSSENLGAGNQIRVLPPSRDCRSSKSILKPWIKIINPASMGELPTLDQNRDISVMLESASQHLAGPSRNSRIDAYAALLGCLSAYDDVPDIQKLAERLPELARFLRRDLLAKNEETGLLDTHLVVQALKLLTFFVATTGILEFLPDDFCSFVMEQSIASLEDDCVPKIVVTHYMLLLAKQTFATKHANSERLNRLITALDGVANRVKGNRVVGQRLMVYGRLLTQARPLMIARVGDWIDHLVTGMLSTIRDIRSWAIYFGLEASLSLGTTKSVSQACVDMFNRVSPAGKWVVDCLASRLNEMTNTKPDAVHVPQIWVIVILFLRSRRQQLESWEHFKPWLLILQNCFNSSDTHVKFQANIAWNRLIYAIDLNPSTSLAMVKMLRQPIASQLDRKSNQKVSKHAKQVARSSYCTLLYYAFRPSSTHAQLDQYWEEYISQMIPCDRRTSSTDIDYTCNILAALLGSPQTKVWNENRANLNELVKPDDLPCLDPKWVRSRSAPILKVVENLLSVADWQLKKDQEAPILLAWRSLTAALGEAGKMEVKVSMETMVAVAQLVNTIKCFWQQGLKQKETAEVQDISNLIDRFEQLILEAVAKIGFIPFNEKRLMQSSQDSFEAAETPSNRSVGSQGPLSSPISSLLNLLVSSIVDPRACEKFTSTVSKLIQLALRSATSRRTQLAVLRDLVYPVSFEALPSSMAKLSLWQLVAEEAGAVLNSPKTNEKLGDSPQNVGHEYRDASKILEAAIRHNLTDAIATWKDLATNLAYNLARDIGNEAITIIVIEPLAAVVHQSKIPECYDLYLESALVILKLTRWPQSRPALERAKKMLWGLGSVSQKQASLDPFDHLYSMTNAVLINSYSRLQSMSSTMMVDFLSAVDLIISSCPLSLKGMLVKQLQPGLTIWIEDAEGLLKSSGPTSDLREAVMYLWAVIATAIEALPKFDSRLLLVLESLIVCSLKSRQKMIVNEAIQMWNRTFGAVEYLEYPDSLRPVLLKLKKLTDLSLPAFPDGKDSEISSSPLNFVETQIDQDQMPRSQQSTPLEFSTKAAGTSRSDNVTGIHSENPSRTSRSLDKGLLSRSPKEQPPKTTPKARLRHDDSQIQFAAIESSPLASDVPDSQILTDRQREVRERQNLEAAIMFPTLGSTPKPKIRERGEVSQRLILKGTQASHTELDPDDSYPMLPAVDDISDEVFGSSPTPRTSRRNSDQRSSSSGPPSSPLGSAQLKGKPCDEPPLFNDPRAQCEVEIAGELLNEDELASEIHIKASAVPMKFSNISDVILQPPVDKSIERSLEHESRNFPPHDSDQEMTDINPPSDSDVLADALSDPLQTAKIDQEQCVDVSTASIHSQAISKPNDNIISQEIIQEPVTFYAPGKVLESDNSNVIISDEEEVSRIMDSFQGSERSYLPSEDEQIAAQLINDLELASSQAEAEINGNASTIKQLGKANKKRKSSAETLGPSKKVKPPRSQVFRVVVESRKTEDADDDNILVDVNERSYLSDEELTGEHAPTRPRTTCPSTRKSSQTEYRTERTSPSITSDDSDWESQASSEEYHLLPGNNEPQIESSSVIPTSVDQCLQRRSALFRQSSTESMHAQSSPLPNHHEDDDDAPQPVEISSCSDSGGEMRQRVSGTRDIERELAVDRPLELHEFCREVAREKRIIGKQGAVSLYQSVEAPNPATQTNEEETGIEQAVSPSRVIGLPSGGDHILSTSRGLDTARSVQHDLLDATKQAGNAMQQDQEPRVEGILAEFKSLLGDIRQIKLKAEEEREMIGALFECVREVHEAGRRSADG